MLSGREVFGDIPSLKFITWYDDDYSITQFAIITTDTPSVALGALSFQSTGIDTRQYRYVHGHRGSLVSGDTLRANHSGKDRRVYPLARPMDDNLSWY